MSVRMYCGELNGEIYCGYIDFRAREVRRLIATMFATNPYGEMQEAWGRAKEEGWRVVPVIVTKEERK